MAVLDTSWSGFCFLQGGQPSLGPLPGKPACLCIPARSGVCGTATLRQITQRVAGVHAFPGHMACDVESCSEIFVHLIKNDRLIGVLDIDSPLFNRLDAGDQSVIEDIVRIYLESID